MGWLMILPNGFIHIERLEGKVNSAKYLKLMERVKCILDSIFGVSNYVYQQDNASIHTSNKALDWFEKSEMKV